MAISKSTLFQQQLSRPRPSNAALKIPGSPKSCDQGIQKQTFVPGSFLEEESSRTGYYALPSEPNHICNAKCGECIHGSANKGDVSFSQRDSSGSSLTSGRNLSSGSTQIFNNLITHPIDAESTIDSDTEDEWIDESAIDDDDDYSDLEDSIAESGKPSIDEKFFQRIKYKVNLASRPSLITLMVANDRAKTLSISAFPRSQSVLNISTLAAPLKDSDDSSSNIKSTPQLASKTTNKIPQSQSNAQPIVTTNNIHAQAALSPRTTRRNMLAAELTESLRRHLLWERQQKSSTANAVLRRRHRHTSHDMFNLKQYPERACLKNSEDVNTSEFLRYFTDPERQTGYNYKGW